MTVHQPVAVQPGKLLICGEWTQARAGKTFAVVNPATEKKLTDVAYGDAADVDAAVAAARQAFDHGPFSRLSPRERGMLLWKLADLVEAKKEELAVLESMDNGKPVSECLGFDLPQVVETFRYYAGWADKNLGEINPVSDQYFSYTLREPAGVVGQIIPWNFPLLMAAWKLGPALACGCTVVLKPAEQTPLTALRLGELVLQAGFPAGVVNIVTGDHVAGAALANHPGVDKVAFTGSTEVGKKVMVAAAQNLKRVSMELGGKSPNVVFDDADIEAAAKGCITSIFFNQGEVCCAGTRLYLHEKIHDRFLDVFTKHAQGLKVGNPLDTATQMGAQVSEEQFARILGYIEKGKAQGAQLLTGGHSLREKLGGYFFEPTIFAKADDKMAIYKEEIFGPVLSVRTFKDTDALVAMANDTPYGLAAGVWTKDVARAHNVARRLKAGTVWVNCYNVFDAAVPFGGYKESGFGRELGKAALELYTGQKAVWMAL
jgi:acyl-CoA reductase-like NAD-dependent aldehyde dehydrogenase